MKKIFIGLVVLLVIIIGGGAFFLLTFDIDKYRPTLTKKIETALGRPVDIGRLSLSWKGAMMLQVSGLKVYRGVDRNSEPGLKLESAHMGLQLGPLLRKEIHITSIMLSGPFIDIVREKDGSVSFGGIDLPSEGRSPAKSVAAESAGDRSFQMPALSVDFLQVEKGEIVFHDRMGQQPVDMRITDIGFRVKNFSFKEPFLIEGRAGVFGKNQNLDIKGQVQLPIEGKTGSIRGLVVKADLNDLDLQAIGKVVPSFNALGLEDKLQGIVEMSIEVIPMDPSALSNLNGRCELKYGYMAFKNFKAPIENLECLFLVQSTHFILDHISGSLAGGTFKVSGDVTQTGRPDLPVNFSVQARDLSIERLARSVAADAPSLSGMLSLDLQGSARGLSWPQISTSLNGSGRLTLGQGVLLNYNVLKEVIDALSVIPGAETTIRQNFPSVYQARLSEKSTILRPVDLPFGIQNGMIYFNPLTVSTDLVAIVGAGQLGLDGGIGADATLLLSGELSAVLIRNVSQLQLLTDERGQLAIPLKIKGRLPDQVKIKPDTNYIAQKVVAQQAQSLATEFVKDPKKGAGSVRDLVKQATGKDYLKNLLGGDESAQTQAASQS